MIVTAKHSQQKAVIPPPQPNIVRADSVVMVGVTIQNDLNMSTHVATKIDSCSRTLFALKTLKAHGMPQTELQEVFRASALSSLLYAAPSWWGFTLATDRDRLSAFLNKAIKSGFHPPDSLSLNAVIERDQNSLFKSIKQNSAHILYPLLPPKRDHGHNLRNRVHPFQIPPSVSTLHDKNFIPRMIRNNSY